MDDQGKTPPAPCRHCGFFSLHPERLEASLWLKTHTAEFTGGRRTRKQISKGILLLEALGEAQQKTEPWPLAIRQCQQQGLLGDRQGGGWRGSAEIGADSDSKESSLFPASTATRQRPQP